MVMLFFIKLKAGAGDSALPDPTRPETYLFEGGADRVRLLEN